MRVNCVFSGGGVKAYAFIGALQSLKNNNYKIERVAGTSAGAIIASLIAAKYTVEEIEHQLNHLQLDKFLDLPLISKTIPFSKWILLYFKMGLYKGDQLEMWFQNILAEKGVHTFADIPNEQLKIIVSDITLGKLVILPDDLERIYGLKKENLSIASAIRMSTSFPYFFMPKKLYDAHSEKRYMVDGGLLSNFPLWIFNQKNTYRNGKTIGFTLQDTLENMKPQKINNAIDMLQATFTAMLHAHDTRYISKSKQDNVVFLPVKEIKTLDLSISKEEKDKCIQIGKNKTDEFIKLGLSNSW